MVRRSGRGAVVGAALAVLGAVAGAVALAGVLVLPVLRNPIEVRTVDHTPPPVLTALRDLSRYTAASASFEVLVDTERDVAHVPSYLAGERTLFIGVGSVDATVDFSGLADGAVVVSADGRTASVRLPRPVLASPVVDTGASHVAARSRGLFDRLAGVFQSEPTSDRPLYLAAEAKMAAAAEATSLRERAETNTRVMLTSLLRGLGVDTVTVVFVDDGSSASSPA